MTPDLLLAGGMTQAEDAEFAHSPGDEAPLIFKYAAVEQPAGTGSYPVHLDRWRLSAAVRRTERGWVAAVAALDALGYGESPETAIEDALDAVEQYLEFIRDDQPTLAPTIVRHAGYVALLDAPRGVWLASVIVDASPLE